MSEYKLSFVDAVEDIGEWLTGGQGYTEQEQASRLLSWLAGYTMDTDTVVSEKLAQLARAIDHD